jgi:hypothetical protein
MTTPPTLAARRAPIKRCSRALHKPTNTLTPLLFQSFAQADKHAYTAPRIALFSDDTFFEYK